MLELNSWNVLPILFIAMVDGASVAAIGTDWAWPTTSTWGTAMLAKTVSASHARMIGTDSQRIQCAMWGRLPCSSTWGLSPLFRVIMRT